MREKGVFIKLPARIQVQLTLVWSSVAVPKNLSNVFVIISQAFNLRVIELLLVDKQVCKYIPTIFISISSMNTYPIMEYEAVIT